MKRRTTLIYLCGSLLAIVSLSLVLFLNWTKIAPEIPWFYSLPWGEGQLIPRIWVAIGLTILVIVNILNTLLANYFLKVDKIVSNVIMGANFLITILYLISLLKVLSIIT